MVSVAPAASPSGAAASASSCCSPTCCSAGTRARCPAWPTRAPSPARTAASSPRSAGPARTPTNAPDCRIVGFVNSIQDYWTDAFAQSGPSYQPADTVLFDGVGEHGLRGRSSAVGPFYCPLDTHVYLDLGFYDELQQRFGAEGGPLAEGYVVAHEYGHHVENLLGVLEGGSRDAGAEGTAVRIELMADCLAGVWARNAESTGFLRQLTRSDIAQALDAAAAVGDDRIQERIQGQVTPETWTHGSSEQRQQWFLTGYEGGRVDGCDTFRADL